MNSDFQFVHLTAEQWLNLAEQSKSESLTANVRVSNNLFHSMQWIGKEVIDRTERKYFGIQHQKMLVCTLEIFRISENVIRTRGLYCVPEFRRKGLMRQCLDEGLKYFKGRAKKAIAFAELSAVPFYENSGFKKNPTEGPRVLEYYNFKTSSYEAANNNPLLFMEKFL